MVDTINSVAASAGRDPDVSAVGQIRRGSSLAKSTPPAKAAEATRSVAGGDVLGVVEELNAYTSKIGSTRITFVVDAETGKSVVEVRDKETGELIRQVPPEELLRLISNLKGATGLIFSGSA